MVPDTDQGARGEATGKEGRIGRLEESEISVQLDSLPFQGPGQAFTASSLLYMYNMFVEQTVTGHMLLYGCHIIVNV